MCRHYAKFIAFRASLCDNLRCLACRVVVKVLNARNKENALPCLSNFAFNVQADLFLCIEPLGHAQMLHFLLLCVVLMEMRRHCQAVTTFPQVPTVKSSIANVFL